MCFILVPPKTDFIPSLTLQNPERLSQNLAGPYLEDVNEDFTCYIRNVLPGKDSTSFKFYYDSKLRLQSKNGIGKVVENDESDGTKYVEWKFTNLFDRSDNGGTFRCDVDWKAGQYQVMGLRSKLIEYVNVTCKCPTVYFIYLLFINLPCLFTYLFMYLFGFKHTFQHCRGRITMISFMGRGNHLVGQGSTL